MAAASFSAKLKWQKQKFDIEINPTNSVVELKAQIFSLTGVPVERQKLTCPKAWKGQLTDDMTFANCKLKAGLLIMLIGSADTLAAKVGKTVFIEDMKEEEKAGVSLPAGFTNLGNTCYMNSTLQCIRAIPELRESLSAFQPRGGGGGASAGCDRLTFALRNTLNGADRTTSAFPPMEFWTNLRQLHPQFAQTGRTGAPMQQDAEELYSSAMASISQSLKDTNTGALGDNVEGNMVDALMGLEMEETLTCDETGETGVKREITRKMVCNIQGGGGINETINHLTEGIALGLKGTLVKFSEALQRDATWTRTQKISRLPRYICVQFMRFYWKHSRAIEEGREVERGEKCKIMRPVTFPETLDIYNFCSDKVQEVLKLNRDRHGDEILGDLKRETNSEPGLGAAEESKAAEEKPSDPMEEDEDEDLKAALALSTAMNTADSQPVSNKDRVGYGLDPDFQGNYELFALVTHKGRLADGGHYIGWVRQEGDDWLVFDDADVSPCKTEDVLPLKGGGDYHMAYLTFYRSKN
uniref:Ubiquitin carboxyl-terminal hydrolase n=1 Tax=Octactis speculum TaxID=3111310 RepID=A0A7S2DHH2_9STRA|mmetsp:Transcript_48831/g.66548  ORF Transcript_48831/g.66548 Transcript_48831/m.66548 type:complete len:526 (+) Transcript_48831:162-1739(+)